MAANIYDWSLTAANNSNADGDLTWAEGQAPSTVNNSARVMMQRGKQLLVDIGGSIAAGGTPNGLTVTAASPFAAYADGEVISFRATASNTGTTTLNVNSIGAKALRKMSSTGDIDLVADEIKNTGIYVAQYSAALNGAAGAWLLVNPTPLPPSSPSLMPIGAVLDYAGTTAPSLWLLCFGQSLLRTDYVALFAVIGTTYGAVDGTHFTIPDYRGRVLAGKDDMGGTSANRLTGLAGGVNGDTIGGVGGVETHTLASAELNHTQTGGHTHTGPSHTHTFSDASSITGNASTDHAHSYNTNGGSSVATGSSGSLHTHTVSVSGTTGAGGTGATSSNALGSTVTSSATAHNNIQPTIIATKIIYAGV